MKTVISFRLRKELDADLIEAMGNIHQEEIKNLVRDGLRLILGIRTTKRVEVAERPINVRETPLKLQPASPIRSKPAVFIPERGR